MNNEGWQQQRHNGAKQRGMATARQKVKAAQQMKKTVKKSEGGLRRERSCERLGIVMAGDDGDRMLKSDEGKQQEEDHWAQRK